MVDKSQEQMVAELYQAIVGIMESPNDNGLIGDIAQISDKLDLLNGRVRGNEVRSKVNQGIIGTIGGGGILGILGKVLSWW